MFKNNGFLHVFSLTCFKNYKGAIAALQKRREPDTLVLDCIRLLEAKIPKDDAAETDPVEVDEAVELDEGAGPSNANP